MWLVRPSVLGRPLIDRSQYVRDADERPSPIYLGLDDVPSLNFLVGLCLLVLVVLIVGPPPSPSVVAYLSGKK